MHDDVVEEEGDWMWEKDGRRKDEVSKCRLAFCSCSCFLGCAFLALPCLALLWWTEVGGRVGWLAAGGGWAKKVCRGAVRGCDVRSCRGPGGLSLHLRLQQGPQPRSCFQIPTLSYTILDNKNTLYLLDNSGDMYPFGSAVLSGNKWMRKSRFTRCA
jgi:hypothetical protein